MSRKNFNLIPQVRFNRSKFEMPHGVKTSMNVGTLYPISVQEVLPGDSFKSDVSVVARVASSFLKPVMDNAVIDVYHFYVPLRQVFSGLEGVFGSADPSSYVSNNLGTIPSYNTQVTIGSKTVWDYLGVTPGTVAPGLTVLAPRAFALIYDKWFRSENVCNEMYVQKGALVSSEIPNTNAWAANNYVGYLPKVKKKADYFTSCLPAPQKGVNVSLPLGTSANVYGNGDALGLVDNKSTSTGTTNPMSLGMSSGSFNLKYGTGKALGSTYTGSQQTQSTWLGVVTKEQAAANTAFKSGLIADLSTATAANVNDLRFAFQLQKMLERDALYGSRYNEYLLAHYGVTSPDQRIQFPEYLGGGRFPVSVQQVAQTSEASSSSPLANVAGYSLSNGRSRFSKGFTEHGYIFTVACIRTFHTYQQGVPKKFTRTSRNDFYDPLYASLGEQPVYRSELYIDGTETTLKDNVFGYNEAWADYRYIPSTISGEMRSSATNSYDIWHFADKYSSAPTLSASFIEETPANIDRTLSVPSSTADQFIVDFQFNTSAIRVMPTYSIPGLIDHH